MAHPPKLAATTASPRQAALITGGAKRLGRAIVERLALQGFDIAIHCNHSQQEAIALCRTLREHHPGIECGAFQANLATPSEAASLIQNVSRSFPNLSVLVNNAAIYQRAPLLETSDELLDESWRVNVRAPIVLAREFARFLQSTPHSSPGHLIQILDARIAAPRSNEWAYEFSKRALATATELLARELAPTIFVNAIAPGSVLAPEAPPSKPTSKNFHSVLSGLHNRGDLPPETTPPPKSHTPDPAGTSLFGYHPSPENVAQAVALLASSSSITGQTLFIDAGLRLA